MQSHIKRMTQDPSSSLFVVDIDKDKLWKLYLDSFPEGGNPMFRTRTEHDCSTCRHFVKSFGNVVTIKNNDVTTIWDVDMLGTRYEPVVKALSKYVKSCLVSDVFFSDTAHIGVEENFEKTESSVLAWEHFHVELPSRFVKSHSRETLGTLRSQAHATKDVFKRSLEEISEDSVQSVLELIVQNSLYKGEEWKGPLEAFLKHKKVYATLPADVKDLYAWEQSQIAGPVVGKIRNHSIGVLLVDISKGEDLDQAVRKYEAIVAPSHYKRPKPVFTKKMLEEAEQTITELGYIKSLGRRHAVLDDITVNNILFANRSITKLTTGSVFSEMAKDIRVSPKSFGKVEEVPIEKFISEILPTAQTIEILLENKHAPNLVSLIAPIDKDAPTMFKWPNGFSWSYSGNMTDSMKQRVKALGGNVEGALRFSIQWNDVKDNEDDLDAHCIEPTGNEIYFRNKAPYRHPSSGILDVDIIRPSQQAPGGVAVENITWSQIDRMFEGTYKFFVHCYNHRGGKSGFTAEIEFNGQIYSFAYNQPLRLDEKVCVAEVTFNHKTGFSIKELISSSLASRKLWNLDTNQWHPVSVVMMSPNYWGKQEGIGNKHVFFMLDGCKNPEQPNGFFNEFIKEDLLKHKRVFEALGTKMRVIESDDQLSGIGFSTTQRNEVLVRVIGHVSRVIKVII